jgi:hypothetical protein
MMAGVRSIPFSFQAMTRMTGHMLRIYSLATIATLAIFMGGCATYYEVDVDALSNPNAPVPGFSYEIVPLNPSLRTNTEQFLRARQLVRKALTTVGMYEVQEGDPADVTIGIDFGVGMRQAGTITTGMNSPINNGIGPVTSVAGIPTRPMVSTTPSTYTSYNFRKYLSIVASTEGSVAGTRTELWRVDVALVDKGDNIEYYLPILAGVASEYMATDTGEKTTVHVSGDDEMVHWVQQDP